MIQTPIYKFKKPELTDSPPDITATNSNWDTVEEQINVLSSKIDIGILRSGTLADYILKHGRNGGVGGNTHEASMTDLPEQKWGMFHVMKHASEVWTVIWYSDYNSTHYERQLRSEGWVTEWKTIATTSKTDIKLLNDWVNAVENQVPLCAARSGNIVTIVGLVSSPTATQYHAIGQLPEGYRPAKFVNPRVSVNGVLKDFIIRSDGTIAPNENFGANAGVQINVSFPID